MFHGKACPHSTHLTTLGNLYLELLSHGPYNPDLDFSNYHFFGPFKKHVGRKEFQTDEALQKDIMQGVLTAAQFALRSGNQETATAMPRGDTLKY